MFFKELTLAIRRNFLLNLLSSLLVLFSLVLIFVTLFYIDSNRISSIVAGDEVVDGTQMALLVQDRERRHEGDLIEGLRHLYDLMIDVKEFDTLIFYPLSIELSKDSFRVPQLNQNNLLEEFGFGEFGGEWISEETIFGRVLNFGYLENFPLSISEGRTFEKEDFGTYKDYIPLILGSQFVPYYGIGEILEGVFFNYSFQFIIIGFLEAAHPGPDFDLPSDWFYSLDDIALLPFMDFSTSRQHSRQDSTIEEERSWNLFLDHFYGNVMQPWIRLEDTREALDHALNLMISLSDYAGLPMVFTEMHPILIRNTVTRNTIAMNMEAIMTFLISACILISIVLYYFSKVKYLRKQEIYQSLSLLGISKYKQIVLVFMENALFLMPTLFLALYYLIYWSNLIVSWSVISHQFDKWSIVGAVMFNTWEWNVPSAHLLWGLIWFGIGFYLIQSIYPVWKIISVYRGGKSDA